MNLGDRLYEIAGDLEEGSWTADNYANSAALLFGEASPITKQLKSMSWIMTIAANDIRRAYRQDIDTRYDQMVSTTSSLIESALDNIGKGEQDADS